MTNHLIELRSDLEMDSGMAENANWVGRSRSMAANGSFIRKTGDERKWADQKTYFTYHTASVLCAGGTEQSAKSPSILKEVTQDLFRATTQEKESLPIQAQGPEKQKGNGIITLNNIYMDLELHANLMRKKKETTKKEAECKERKQLIEAKWHTHWCDCHTSGLGTMFPWLHVSTLLTKSNII